MWACDASKLSAICNPRGRFMVLPRDVRRHLEVAQNKLVPAHWTNLRKELFDKDKQGDNTLIK